MDLNLHRLVKDTVDQFPETADPGILADKVFDLITSDQYAEAVRTMLRSYVRRVMTEGRGAFLASPASVTVPSRPGPQGAPRSRYVEAIRAGAWRARLGERTHGANGWLLLRDCTRADLLAAAEERRNLAVANVQAAETYDKLAELLTAHGKATVSDLPDTVLETALSG